MKLTGILKSFGTVMALAGVVPMAWASNTYSFVGSVTSVPDVLSGAGIAVGDDVHMDITAGRVVPDIDTAPTVGHWAGSIESWTMTIGAFSTAGLGGDVLVCDHPRTPNCGSAVSLPFFSGVAFGKDAVRFVTRGLTSPPIVLNGKVQSCADAVSSCGNANIYNDSALALTGTEIPPVLDRLLFNSAINGGRVIFAEGPVLYSLTAVPEPGTWALWLVGLGLLGAKSRRSRL